MAQIVYRGNLSAATFPLLSTLHSKSVIVRGPDQAYMPVLASKEDADKDTGIPQVCYLENVLPQAQGFQAVNFNQIHNPISASPEFTSVHQISDADGNVGYIAFSPDGDFYTLQFGDAYFNWVASIPSAAGKKIYVAHVSGVSYIHVSNYYCYKYTFATRTLNAVTLLGLTITDIIGICASSGYMVAWSANAIAWSSLADPTDFVPSLATGAGGGSVEDIVGSIFFLVAHQQGFYVHAHGNIVAAIASGNVRYPFSFKVLSGSGGCQDPELTVIKSSSASQYAYTTFGVQAISPQGVQNIFPEVTDFLAGQIIETFDPVTNVLSQTALSAVMKKKLTVVSNRYLVFSYGATSLTHALVYDTQHKRWGKLVIDHVDCFEYNLVEANDTEAPKKQLAFLQDRGQIQLVDISLENINSSGVIILGKYQYVRSRLLMLEQVDLENVYDPLTTTCHTIRTLDGKQPLTPIEGVVNESSSSLNQSYNFRATGMNHSILVKGAFHLVSIVLTFNVAGAR
jgi:hypothetical protein